MKKQGTERRVYTGEFKAEVVALAEKREKPVSQVAVDLGVNESMLRRWMQEARETAQTGRRTFPGPWAALGRGADPPAQGEQGAEVGERNPMVASSFSASSITFFDGRHFPAPSHAVLFSVMVSLAKSSAPWFSVPTFVAAVPPLLIHFSISSGRNLTFFLIL